MTPLRGSRRFVVAFLTLLLIVAAWPAGSSAQRRGNPPPRAAVPRPPVELRAQVFIGGYFYDPTFGRYPWWLPGMYPYRYYPHYDRRAELRVRATPKDAAVYVDGFYAGVVDDFDGVFQSLPLTPGTHEITLYLQGFRTQRYWIYLAAASTMNLRASLERLPRGAASEPPTVAPPLPPPPPGSYRQPRTSPPLQAQPLLPPANAPPANPTRAEGFGTLELQVVPAGATVTIDGEIWQSSDGRRFVIEIAAGRHRLEVTLEGYKRFATDVEIREGAVTPVNVSLTRGGDKQGS